jgi:hypothetical protein
VTIPASRTVANVDGVPARVAVESLTALMGRGFAMRS